MRQDPTQGPQFEPHRRKLEIFRAYFVVEFEKGKTSVLYLKTMCAPVIPVVWCRYMTTTMNDTCIIHTANCTNVQTWSTCTVDHSWWIQSEKSECQPLWWLFLWQKPMNFIWMSPTRQTEDNKTRSLIFRSGLLKRKPSPVSWVEVDPITVREAVSLLSVSQQSILTTI